ncbi:MAG: DegV family protein [Anaerolineaceae bacterium]|nr:DegV family protein [Anaerolineaceae bacterium]
MQIVTDRACDLSAPQREGLEIHYVPMRFTLDGKTYSSGVDVTSETFYDLLEKSNGFPTTSQPSSGEFADVYRKLAKTDPEILSIHISSGLSGTMNSARAGAAMVPEAKVTFWDTKTLSCPEAWQVEVAARALLAGWPLSRIFDLLERIGKKSEGIFTVDTLKYLIHGGRISHLKGLLASVLKIRPIIAVDKVSGKYYTLAQERTEKRSIEKIAEIVSGLYPEGTRLRVQLLHGKCPEILGILREKMSSMFDCCWTPTTNVAPILGAHTGKGVVGLSVGPADLFSEVPGICMN